jgi:hypothetical protein
MIRSGDNLKGSSQVPSLPLKDTAFPLSYTKADKLITALYMVTDIIDKEEPLRNKLRTLGVSILSDIKIFPLSACPKIGEVLSFLDIARALNIISPMNCDILRKEFYALDHSILEWAEKTHLPSRHINLSEYLREELPASKPETSANLGVQKGSTLMKSLHQVSDKISASSQKSARVSDTHESHHHNVHEELKGQRRADILNIIKSMGGSATITDIKTKVSAVSDTSSLHLLGEKTLQRELVSMVKDNVLKKSGDKRWSKYSI